MRIAVGIATRGRAGILGAVLDELRRQRRAADHVLVCHVTEEDVAALPARFPEVTFLAQSPGGLTRQRNRLMDAAPEAEVMLFLDDDFLPAPEWIAVLEAVMARRPDCVVATGTVIADGAKGPGIGVAEGRAILAADAPPPDPLAAAAHFNGYGCNMAVRLEAVRRLGLRFDERLPLYGWYEDIDFTRRLLPAGRILRLAGARGVHLGVKQGRVPGIRLGYSQVVNPVYLALKGSFPWSHALPSAGRHLLINLLRSAAPEPEVDRRGRFRGNLLGLWDLLRGRITPERITAL